MENPIIETVELTKQYDTALAVDHLNLSIKKGEVFGLLGPNGAGKSTTILMMLGLTEPSLGEVMVCGIDSTRYPTDVKKRVGYLPEDVGFYDDLSGMENLIYTARLNSLSYAKAKRKAADLLQRVGLPDEGSKKAGKYSRGMRQRLGLADVLIKNPEVIILDEPTSGIDPQGVKDFLKLIVQLSKEEEITVLFSSHNLHQVQQVCDRVGLFIKGKLIAEGDIQSLSQKLFSNELFVIEAGISSNDPSGNGLIKNPVFDKIQHYSGVNSLILKDHTLQVSCTHNLAPEIAALLVNSGIKLNYLNHKEYGLDEIYQRYFEGGDYGN